ncbi:MAG: hypothetical protein WBP12_00920 [Candidatus Saccharimonas sp.]
MKSIIVAVGAVVAIASAIIGLSGTPAGATSESCASPTDRNNIVYSWKANDQINVTLKKPVCEDLTLYFSSYEMPDTWDGKGFNATAVPQVWKASSSVTFKAKAAAVAKDLTVILPNECKNAQIDLYFAPEIVNLPNTGHGAQYITHKFQTKVTECETPVPPVVPPVTPTTPTEPTTPSELPQTGAVSVLAMLAPTVAAIAYIGASIRQDILARQK